MGFSLCPDCVFPIGAGESVILHAFLRTTSCKPLLRLERTAVLLRFLEKSETWRLSLKQWSCVSSVTGFSTLQSVLKSIFTSPSWLLVPVLCVLELEHRAKTHCFPTAKTI